MTIMPFFSVSRDQNTGALHDCARSHVKFWASPVRCEPGSGPGYGKICGAGLTAGRMIKLRGGCGLNVFSPRSFFQNVPIVCACELGDYLIALCVCVHRMLCMHACIHSCMRATSCRAWLHACVCVSV